MRYALLEGQRDFILLLARIFLMILFVLAGWGKLTGFEGTVSYMTSLGAPAPMLAAGVAVIMEFLVAILLILGFYTRPLALLFALFVLGTALLGHPFWNMVDPERSANMTQFLKNLSIVGGLLALAVSGPGRFSLDRHLPQVQYAIAATSIVAVIVPGRVILLVIEIILQLLVFLDFIQRPLRIRLRVEAVVKFVVKQMVVLGLWQIVFFVHHTLHTLQAACIGASAPAVNAAGS